MDFLSQDPAICRSAVHRHGYLRTVPDGARILAAGRSAGGNNNVGLRSANILRTQQYNPIWLDEPNFVGSYEIGDFVYFFFRESAVEHMNCGKVRF
jgi:hypothetical protein